MTENSYEQTLAVAVDTGRPVLEREQAIHKLGESATPDVVDHLIKLLEDNEDGVRWAASSARWFPTATSSVNWRTPHRPSP